MVFHGIDVTSDGITALLAHGFDTLLHMVWGHKHTGGSSTSVEDGAQGQNRTADTGIFSPLLYRLSYLGKSDVRGSGPSRERRIRRDRAGIVKSQGTSY